MRGCQPGGGTKVLRLYVPRGARAGFGPVLGPVVVVGTEELFGAEPELEAEAELRTEAELVIPAYWLGLMTPGLRGCRGMMRGGWVELFVAWLVGLSWSCSKRVG